MKLFKLFYFFLLVLSFSIFNSFSMALVRKILKSSITDKVRVLSIEAAYNNNVAGLEYLIEKCGENILKIKTEEELNLLHISGFCGNIHLFCLIKKYQNIFNELLEQKNKNGETPFLYTAVVIGQQYLNDSDEGTKKLTDKNRRDMLSLLAERGASIEIPDSVNLSMDIYNFIMKIRAGKILF